MREKFNVTNSFMPIGARRSGGASSADIFQSTNGEFRVPSHNLEFNNSKHQHEFRNEIISSIPENVFNQLNSYFEKAILPAGLNLYQPGDLIHKLYFPETAVVTQFSILEDGRTIETLMIGSEGVTGIPTGFISGVTNQFTQVLIGGTATSISLEKFKLAFDGDVKFRTVFLDYSNVIFSQTAQRIGCIHHHLLDARFCSWLLMVMNRSQISKLKLTHDQIAGLLGVHRPSITHTAQLLRERNIIKYSRGELTILNRSKLEKMACDCLR